MKFPLLVIAVTLALSGCANTWEGEFPVFNTFEDGLKFDED